MLLAVLPRHASLAGDFVDVFTLAFCFTFLGHYVEVVLRALPGIEVFATLMSCGGSPLRSKILVLAARPRRPSGLANPSSGDKHRAALPGTSRGHRSAPPVSDRPDPASSLPLQPREIKEEAR